MRRSRKARQSQSLALPFFWISGPILQMTQTSQILRHILKKAESLKSKNLPALAVFDLDSTLFDVSPRLKQILHDFSADPTYRRLFPQAAEALKDIEMQKSDWGIRNAVIRAGLDHHHPEFHQSLREFWLKTFFSNEYLKYDRPYEGAVNFVARLQELNVDIVYLTGRDVHRMGAGSRQTLLHWNFPLDDQRYQLVLKPEQGLDDAEFKSSWFRTIPDEKYQQIWFFENEPVNVHKVREHHPHIDILFFDSTHSGKAHPPTDLPRLIHFLIEEGGL